MSDLDFSELFNQDCIQSEENKIIQDTHDSQKGAVRKLSKEAEDHKRSLEVYKTYQRNTIKASTLQTEILKGLRTNEDIYGLMLKALEAISLMTGDDLFYTLSKEECLRHKKRKTTS